MAPPRFLLPGGDPPRSVLLVRVLAGMGDLLCSTPAWRALRQALPEAHLALLGAPAAAPLLARTGLVDELVPFAGWPGLPESPSVWPADHLAGVARLQARQFDLVVQQHGSGVASNPFAALAGGRITAGFCLPGQWSPDPDRFLPYPADLPEVRRHLALLRFLGVPDRGEHLELRLLDGDRAEAERLRAGWALDPGGYACLCPGATTPLRRWPPAAFARVGDALAARGLAVLVTGSPAERDVCAAVVGAMGAAAVDGSGATSLGSLAALLAGAAVVVTNDSAPSHLAAALGVPSVVVFVASDPDRWAPLDRVRHRMVAAAGLLSDGRCARCLRDGCVSARSSPGPPPSVDEVLAALP